MKVFKPGSDPVVEVAPAHRALAGVRNFLAKPLSVLMGAVGLILLIACANIAGLLTARHVTARLPSGWPSARGGIAFFGSCLLRVYCSHHWAAWPGWRLPGASLACLVRSCRCDWMFDPIGESCSLPAQFPLARAYSSASFRRFAAAGCALRSLSMRRRKACSRPCRRSPADAGLAIRWSSCR